MPPEARVASFLATARRRVAAIEIARAVAIACAAGAGWILLRGWQRAPAVEILVTGALVLLAAMLTSAVRLRSRPPAPVVERRTDAFHNALITSAQMLRGEVHARPDIRALVLGDTAARAERVDLGVILPIRNALGTSLLGVAALSAAVTFGVTRSGAVEASTFAPTGRAGAAGAARVSVRLTPPAYTALKAQQLDNPDRVETVEGSRVVLSIDGREALDVRAATQTYLQSGEILIPMTVTPDRAPDVRIAAPARDLFLADTSRDIPVRATASDDFGVTSLTLAYTKVSGSGETFDFVEGTLPLSLSRASGRELSGTATFQLAALGLSAGDMLVYRAIARDAHPTRGPAESDAYVIEMVSPSEALAEGFSIDDQRDTYALSQQMVILKTERLVAARRGMTPEAVAEEAARIGAEQRQVRAEFVFMMGGEIEDEEVEAEQSHELSEGREQNEGRRDLIAAIRSMSDAAALLLRPDLDQALAAEKRALAALQRALTRSRYILRVLSTRERIDDTRRLTGDRSTAPGWRRDLAAAEPPPEVRLLRDAIRDLGLLARKDAYDDRDRAAITSLATRLLASGRAEALRGAVDPLTAAARARNPRDAAALLDRAALALDAALETSTSGLNAPPPAASPRVRSALADRLRAGRAAGGGQ